jgi:hypothetical protein
VDDGATDHMTGAEVPPVELTASMAQPGQTKNGDVLRITTGSYRPVQLSPDRYAGDVAAHRMGRDSWGSGLYAAGVPDP